MISSLSLSQITVKRKTPAIVSDQSVALNTVVSVSAEGSATIVLVFSSGVSGEVTLTGTYNSSSQSETVLVSSNTVVMSAKQFDTLTSIAMDSSIVATGYTFSAKLSGSDGGVATSLSTIVSAWPMRIVRGKPKWDASEPMGSIEVEKFYALVEYDETWAPKTGDIFINDNTAEDYLVVGLPTFEGIGYMKHWNIRLVRRQGY